MQQHLCITMKTKIKVRRRGHDDEDAQSSSAQIVASIDELLTQILVRLPTKSLMRFKIVSKHWHSLITDPLFSPLPNPAVGLFLQDSDNPRFEFVSFSANKSTTINPPISPKLNFTQDPSGIGILQSCNGLLICSSFQAWDYNPSYYIYNPTTRGFSKLVPKPDGNSTVICGMSLGFDPAKSPHYKVVCVRGSDSGEYKYQFEIYSSETGQWRECGEPFAAPLVNFKRGVYWNGAIHWFGEFGDSLYLNLDDDEMPKILSMPPMPDGYDWRSIYYFGESCDHLHYIDLVAVLTQFNVYEMKRDYSEWFVKYQVDISPLIASYPVMDRDNYDPDDWSYYGFSISALVRGEKEEDSFLVFQIPGKVIRYNLVYETFEAIYEFEGAELEVAEGYLRFRGTNAFQYIESLYCV